MTTKSVKFADEFIEFYKIEMYINDLVINDPVFNKKEKYNSIDKFALKYIRDERDLPFIYLMMRVFVMVVPFTIIMFIPGMFSWWIAVPYIAVNFIVNGGPFILMVHNTSHRKLFKKEYEWMNQIIPWFLGPLFGESPETYYGHHIGMHHPENNLPEDISCTMAFQRDSIGAFGRYFFRFLFFGLPDLGRYHYSKKRYDFMRRVLIGELGFYSLCVALLFVNWQATLVVFVIPLVLSRFSMMAGNWGQHAFIDANDPANCYKNSITCVNAGYNKICFNDGYHIGHHLRPALHWTDMPGDFIKHKAEYVKNDAIIFEKIDFFVAWFLLMTHNYKALAKKYVHLDDRFKSDAEVIAFLKTRTRRFPAAKILQFTSGETPISKYQVPGRATAGMAK